MRALAMGGIAALLLAGAAGAEEAGDDWGGFEEDEEFEVEVDHDGPAVPERWWDIDGSFALSSSINYFDHEFVNLPGDSPARTSWTGLSRLRARVNLQLDFELPCDWKLRVSPYFWYDFTYLIRGPSNYTRDVLDEYEWEVDLQDTYLEGPLLKSLDLKIGRQVVNWGRSDTLRVLDVLNPIDNREPGRADIEDLRRSVGMVKLDWHIGRHWRITGIAIPEMRFDDLPSFGTDFTFFDLGGMRDLVPPGVPDSVLDPIIRRLVHSDTNEPDHFEDTQWAAAVVGIFEGWDISFHFADVYEHIPRLKPLDGDILLTQQVAQEYDRILMAGVGGNYIFGSWLFKAEAAWLHGFEYTYLGSVPLGPFLAPRLETTDKKSRLDVMGGIEYYGFEETTLALEIVNRHSFDYERLVLSLPTRLRAAGPEPPHLSARELRGVRRPLHGRLAERAAEHDLAGGHLRLEGPGRRHRARARQLHLPRRPRRHAGHPDLRRRRAAAAERLGQQRPRLHRPQVLVLASRSGSASSRAAISFISRSTCRRMTGLTKIVSSSGAKSPPGVCTL